MEHTLQLNEFFVEGGDQNKSHALLHISEPATAEEKKKGYFFAVCEINNASPEFIAKLQDMIGEMENDYYEIADKEDKTSLEIALEKINQKTFSFLNRGIELHCVICSMRGNELMLSFCGRPQILIFYQKRNGEYQKMDLVEENKPEPEEEKKQLFAQIVQGKINGGDFMFAGTPHTANYFNHDRLQKIITVKTARESAEHLQRVLSELKNGFSFGGLIINMEKRENAAEFSDKSTENESSKSLSNLFDLRQKTNTILSPSIFPRFGEKIKSITEKYGRQKNESPAEETNLENETTSLKTNSARLHAHTPYKSDVSEKPSNASIAFKIFLKYLKISVMAIGGGIAKAAWWLSVFLWTVILVLGKNSILLLFVIINYKNRRKTILDDWGRQWRSCKENIFSLPLYTKIILGFSIAAFLAVSSGSIIYFKNKRDAAETKIYEDTVQTIKNKKDAAESSLIYNDTTAALAEIVSAKDLFAKLACDTKQRKIECADLNGQIETILSRARKMKTVPVELAADWTNEKANLSGILKLNGKILAFGESTSSIYVYNIISKESAKTRTDASAVGFSAAAAPKENDYALFLYNKKDLISYDPKDNSWKKIEISYPTEETNINGILVYNRRLYSLDAAQGRILKHDSIKTGFERGKPWTEENNEALKENADMAIDGDIFALTKNGKIIKMTKGVKQTFEISGLDPALDSGNKIWTYTDSQYIYILDAKNKRVVILEKDGKLKTQITAAEFANPVGMSVDEPSKTIYILDSDKLYRLNF
ncbi:MAG: hypothetical protein WC430_03620 [Patescibacteria group bacterium]